MAPPPGPGKGTGAALYPDVGMGRGIAALRQGIKRRRLRGGRRCDTLAGVLAFAADPQPQRLTRVLLLAAWLVVAAWLTWEHAPWRDEVRALSLALNGADTTAMLRGVQGEGHPALWYLMLRAAGQVVAPLAALKLVGFACGAGAAALLALRAPFRPWLIALVLAGGWVLVEYTAVSRNYGVALLLMFALAAMPVGRGIVVGVLLALLANTSVPAVLCAGGFVLFRLVEARATRASLRPVLVMGAISAVGVLLCFVTVYPPVNDAAVGPRPGGITAGLVVQLLAAPGWVLRFLAPEALPGRAALLAPLVIALPFGLLRSPAGFVSALATLLAALMFFGLVYGGTYRHHALLLGFVVALHWMVARGQGGTWRAGATSVVVPAAQWLTVALLALQLWASATAVADAARGVPFSSSTRLAALLREPAYARAIVISDSDSVLEALAFQAPNPTWFARERRFGRTVRYRRDVIADLSWADLLRDGRMLRAGTRRPVVFAIGRPIEPTGATEVYPDGFVNRFTARPAEARAFLAATRPVARLDRASGDERYVVYALR